jgi:hypothetical protein
VWLVRGHEYAHPRGKVDTLPTSGKNGEAGENDLPQIPRTMRGALSHRIPLT